MSVTLENIRLASSDAKTPICKGFSLHIPDGSRVGILGASKPENNLILRLICGTKAPEGGTVKRDRRVSWPIPLPSLLLASHTIAGNVRFIMRLYGIDDEAFPRRLAEMVELDEFVNTPLGKCPKFARPRLAFVLGIGLDFETYLFDGSFAPVDKPFKEKAARISAERTAGRAIVVATNTPVEVERNCDSVYVLEEGRVTFFEESRRGVEHFKQLLAMEKNQEKAGRRGASAEEEEGDGPGDVDILGAAVADALD